MTNKDAAIVDSAGMGTQQPGSAAALPTAVASDPSFRTPHAARRIPRVACFTPLGPVSSGISYYSEDLLPVLARALDIQLFVDGYAPTQATALRAAGVRIRDGR